jgi:hypothetical protein
MEHRAIAALLVVRKRPDTLLKIALRFLYAVESPGSWITVGQSHSKFEEYFFW